MIFCAQTYIVSLYIKYKCICEYDNEFNITTTVDQAWLISGGPIRIMVILIIIINCKCTTSIKYWGGSIRIEVMNLEHDICSMYKS